MTSKPRYPHNAQPRIAGSTPQVEPSGAANRKRGASRAGLSITAVLCVLAIIAVCTFSYGWNNAWFTTPAGSPPNEQIVEASHNDSDASLNRRRIAGPDLSAQAQAHRLVAKMSLAEQVGQLAMVPLFAGTDPTALQSAITDRHAGSVLIIGNWNGGTAQVRAATDQLQSYSPDGNHLLIATDQEGGWVQHLTGPGFDRIPAATDQGAMDAAQLRSAATIWGSQLISAGINVDLAPVLGTVVVDRLSNAPIGALYRDFGLDMNGTAEHGNAFIAGMRDAGIQTSVKHYPGLGAVTGNTDFTADGIVDAVTTLSGGQTEVFDRVIRESNPAMVMMALATYQAIDPSTPAVFSKTIVEQHIRGELGYQGVITTDSLSAAAVSGYDPTQLGVMMVEAGGDLACIGEMDYVAPILDGLNARAAGDPAFAAKVTQSAERVMTLKIRMGLAN